MNFKEATDGLFDRISHEQLAEALGVSVAAIRQARLTPTAKAYRAAPREWQEAVIRLAEGRLKHYKHVIGRIRENAKSLSD
jgi:hypothetical protein